MADISEAAVIALVDAHREEVAFLEPLRALHNGRRIEAVWWLVEWETYQWLLQTNKKGIAPSSRVVWDYLRSRFTEDLRGAIIDAKVEMLTANVGRQRKWFLAWRRRWGLQFKAMKAGTELEDNAIRERVSARRPLRKYPSQPHKRRNPKISTAANPKMGPKNVPKNRTSHLNI